jgi:anti-sigma-K factor RskA
MTIMMNEEERFEVDLRAALAPEPASADLRRRVLEQAMPRNQRPARAAGWRALFDPTSWRIPTLVEIGGAAAVASLAVGIFFGASGLVPNSLMLGATTTTTMASNDSSDGSVDLVALAYDTSGIAGDLQ